MLSSIIGLALENWLPIIMALAGALWTGKWYLKGRKDAATKKDAELQREADKFVKDTLDAQDAARNGGGLSDGSLRDDDGFSRD